MLKYSGLVLRLILGPNVWRFLERLIAAGAGAAALACLTGCANASWNISTTGNISTPSADDVVAVSEALK